MPAVTTCARYTQSVIFLPMPAVTTCAGYAESYISTCARLWRPVPGMWIVIFLPMPTMTTCRLCWVCRVLYSYLCQALATCAGYVDCYISTYASCDDLGRVCRVLYFYLCQAVTTCVGFVDCYIFTYASCDDLCRYTEGYIFTYTICGGLSVIFSTYASCDDLCWLCRVLYFYLTVGIDRKTTLAPPAQLAQVKI